MSISLAYRAERALACAVVALSAHASSFAQSPEYRPVGARVGGFVLSPRLDLTGLYDSNIFLTERRETSDFITIVSPVIAAQSDWSRHELRLETGLESGLYADSGDDDYTDLWLRLDGGLDATRATRFYAEELGAWRAHEARGGDDVPADAAEPTLYHWFGGRIGAETRPNRFGVDAWVDAFGYVYDDTPLIGGGTLDGALRNRDEFGLGLRASYELQPGYDAFFEGVYDLIAYDEEINAGGFDRDSDGHRLFGGVAFEPSRLIRAELGAGYMSRDYDDPALDSVDGIFGSLDATWISTPLTTVKLGLASDIEETTAADAAGKRTYDLSLGVEHELLRNLVLNGSAGYAKQVFEGGSSNREDDDLTFDFGARYWINRNFYASAEYDYERRDSNSPGRDHTVHQLGVTLGAQF